MQRLVVSLFVLSAGCVADSGDEGFLIRNNLAPSVQSCSFLPALLSPGFSRGTINMFSPSAYIMSPLIESRISAPVGMESQRTVFIEGARIDLDVQNIVIETPTQVRVVTFTDAEKAQFAADGFTKFKSLFSAPLSPNGGLTAATFDIVPSGLLTIIRNKVGAEVSAAGTSVDALIVANMVLFGKLGGDEIESVPFSYPVTACNDCVVSILGACPQMQTSTADLANSCNPFQDGSVECCTRSGPQGTQVVCPSIEM